LPNRSPTYRCRPPSRSGRRPRRRRQSPSRLPRVCPCEQFASRHRAVRAGRSEASEVRRINSSKRLDPRGSSGLGSGHLTAAHAAAGVWDVGKPELSVRRGA
jgi:hypothetical protein